MITLGIESSCDETALALVEDGVKIRGQIVSSQVKTHAKYGGVVPEIASRQHLESFRFLFKDLLSKSKLLSCDIDQIAVTQGPGLIGGLLVGASYAKGLAHALGVPIVAVNHIRAHIHGALLSHSWLRESTFPAIGLVVSGGHTQVYFMKSELEFEVLARTQDDACGECFDKVAKLLGLPYPGGRQIEVLAQNGDSSFFKMPKIMPKTDNLNFSYSGLKTHMFYLLRKQKKPLEEKLRAHICASFQDAAFEQIVRKLSQIYRSYTEVPIKSILVGGGVAANTRLKSMLQEAFAVPVYTPSLSLCSDNGAMIASYGYFVSRSKEPTCFLQNFDWQPYSRYKQVL